MVEEKRRQIQVIITCGPGEYGRAILGFAIAAAAAVSDIKVRVVLTLDAVEWVVDKESSTKRRVKGFNSVSEYMDVLADSGAEVRLCETCRRNGCFLDRATEDIFSRMPVIGMTEVAIDSSRKGIQTLVF